MTDDPQNQDPQEPGQGPAEDPPAGAPDSAASSPQDEIDALMNAQSDSPDAGGADVGGPDAGNVDSQDSTGGEDTPSGEQPVASGVLNQADIDAAMNALPDDAPSPPLPDAAEPAADSGAFDQSDIDALLNAVSPDAANTTPPAAGDTGELSQADIDAALQGASEAAEAPAPAAGDGELSQADIDAALAGTTAEAAPDTRLDSAGRPFDEEAAAMAAALAEAAGEDAAAPAPEVPAPTAVDLPDFAAGATGDDSRDISILRDVNLSVQIELGRTHMYIEDVLKLAEGSVVELDNLAGDPVDVVVNGRLVARGEVLVLSDNFCVRISEIVTGPRNVAVA